MNQTAIVIVGAGAAGLATAIFARQGNPDRPIVLLDSARRPGAKILVSGGGRCNVTNAVVNDTDFWGGKRTVIRQILRAFPVDRTVEFFRNIGVQLHEEAGGKLFPDTNRARDVLEALLRTAAEHGVDLRSNVRVQAITRAKDGFDLITSAGQLHAQDVVLATGGQSLPKTGSDGTGYGIARSVGHTIVPLSPALAPLLLDPETAYGIHRDLSGVSVDAEITVWVDSAVALRLAGALLWTHFGVSGPVALNASRHWAQARIASRSVRLTVSFYPGAKFEDVNARWKMGPHIRPGATARSLLASDLPDALAVAILGVLALAPEHPIAELMRDDRRRLAHALTGWPLPVLDTRGYNYAEATAGGVALDEIDPRAMESRLCRRLYLVGEMLDVDGRLGGFNFQWAWSTAFVAARALATRA